MVKSVAASKPQAKVNFLLSEVSEETVLGLMKENILSAVKDGRPMTAAEAVKYITERFENETIVSTKKAPVVKEPKWTSDVISVVTKKPITLPQEGSKQEELLPLLKEQLNELYPDGWTPESLDIIGDAKKLRPWVQSLWGHNSSLASNYARLTIERIKVGL